MKSITPEQFKKRFGFDPIDDDIERVVCQSVGQHGHYSCGVCLKHKKPRYVCGCLRKSRKQIEGVENIKHVGKR